MSGSLAVACQVAEANSTREGCSAHCLDLVSKILHVPKESIDLKVAWNLPSPKRLDENQVSMVQPSPG